MSLILGLVNFTHEMFLGGGGWGVKHWQLLHRVHLYRVKRLLSGPQRESECWHGGDGRRLFTQPRHKSELQSGCFVMEMWQVGTFEVPVMGPPQPEFSYRRSS